LEYVIVEPSFEVFMPHPADDLYTRIERAGRMSHGSEGPPGERPFFMRRLIAMGHESVLEHASINAVIKTDRGVMAELTRHRVGIALTVASTRYINYGPGGKPFEVIKPPFPSPAQSLVGDVAVSEWASLMEAAEDTYRKILNLGCLPELARSVLPLSFATDIFMTCNVRQWRHVFKQRTAKAAHPQMRALMRDGLAKLQALYPALFEDIQVDG
jgi:thymidylate synthase (FAD)